MNCLQPLPRSPWRKSHQTYSECRFWKGPKIGAVSSCPWSADRPTGSGTQEKTHPSATLEVPKGPRLGSSLFQPQTVSCLARIEFWQETHLYFGRYRKGPRIGSGPSSHSQGTVQPSQGPSRQHSSLLLEPRIQNSILAVEPEKVLGLHFSPSQPWSRTSFTHPGTHPVTQHQPSQGPGGSHTHLVPGNRLAEWGPDLGP